MLYVPSIVKKKIQYPAIGKGELVTITSAEKKSGTLRSVKWLITASDTGVSVGAHVNKNATSQKRRGAGAQGLVHQARLILTGFGHDPHGLSQSGRAH